MPDSIFSQYRPIARSGKYRERIDYDADVRKKQQDDPTWKKVFGGALDAVANIPKGILGIDPAGDESSAGYVANALTQLGGSADGLSAGIPFAVASKGKNVYHGTRRAIEELNPLAWGNNKGMLSKMSHFAENPKYADMYAMGLGNAPGKNANIIPAKVDAKNVLDMYEPTMDEMSQFVASLEPDRRRPIIDAYKSSTKMGSTRTNANLQEDILGALEERDVIDKMPYDAVKYSARGEPSYAVPEQTNVTTPWGTSLSRTDRTKYNGFEPVQGIPLRASSIDPAVKAQNDKKIISDYYNRLDYAKQNPEMRKSMMLNKFDSELNNLRIR